jgi:hypothetical protein
MARLLATIRFPRWLPSLIFAFGAAACAAPRHAQPDPAFQREAALCDDEDSCRTLWEQAVRRDNECRSSGGDARDCATPEQDREILASKVTSFLQRRVARERAGTEAKQAAERAREAREDELRAGEEAARLEREQLRLREEDKATAAAREEAQDWAKVDIGACVYGPTLGSCDEILSYIGKYRTNGGAHLEEANKTIAQIREPLKAAAERELWQSARPASCAAATAADSCDGVVFYLKYFSDGKHASEAQRALRKGTTRLLALHRVPEHAAPVAPASAVARPPWTIEPQAPAWSSGDSYAGGSGGSVHVKAYTKRDGTHVEAHTRAAPRR